LEVIVVEGGFYNRFNIVLNIMFAKKESQVLLQEIAKMREIMFSTMTIVSNFTFQSFHKNGRAQPGIYIG